MPFAADSVRQFITKSIPGFAVGSFTLLTRQEMARFYFGENSTIDCLMQQSTSAAPPVLVDPLTRNSNPIPELSVVVRIAYKTCLPGKGKYAPCLSILAFIVYTDFETTICELSFRCIDALIICFATHGRRLN